MFCDHTMMIWSKSEMKYALTASIKEIADSILKLHKNPKVETPSLKVRQRNGHVSK